MRLLRLYLGTLGGFFILAIPLSAQRWWVETTHKDFVDGKYSAVVYAADTSAAAGDGAVEMIHWRDIDKDGKLDFIISNCRTGVEGGSIGAANYAYHYDSLEFIDSLPGLCGSSNLIVDADNDGNLDVVLSTFDDGVSSSDAYSRILYGPTWSRVDSFFTRQAAGVSSADLNKDGKLDLVFSNNSSASNYAYIYHQGMTGRDSLLCANCYGNAIADMNKDGNLDIILVGDKAIIYYGPNYATSNEVFDRDSLITGVSCADLNKDGNLDLVLSVFGTYSHMLYGPDFSTIDSVKTNNAKSVSVANLDKDNNLDLVFACNDNNQTAADTVFSLIYKGPNYTTVAPIEMLTYGAFGNIVGDFNSDGNPDVFFANAIRSDSFDIHSYIYYGPTFTKADSVATHAADLCTTADQGNPYDRTGKEIYTSSVFDAADSVSWDTVVYDADIPRGCSFSLFVRTGSTDTPDTLHWSDWIIVSNGSVIDDSLGSRYIQYKAHFSSDFLQAPKLREVKIRYALLIDAGVDTIISPNPPAVKNGGSRAFLFQVRNHGNDTVSIPVHCVLDSTGSIVFDSTVTVGNVAPGDSALALFGGVYCCPDEILRVYTELAGDAVSSNDTIVARLGAVGIKENNFAAFMELTAESNKKGFDISYSLPVSSDILVSVYDASGRLVKNIDAGFRQPGNYTVHWDACDKSGNAISTGTYFIKLSSESQILTRKIIYLD